MTLTAPKQAPCLSSKTLLYLAWAVYTCEVWPILFCLHVHQDAECLQPDIRGSTLNSSAGKLAIDRKGDRIAPEVPLTLAVYNPADPKQRWELLF